MPNSVERMDPEIRQAVRSGTIIGMIPLVPLLVAAVGWTAGWNVYLNLMLTVVGVVLIFVAFAISMERYQK